MANQYRSVLASSGPAPTGGNALPAEVLSGKTFTNDNGAQTGTMTNNGAVNQTLSAGQSYTIPEGYHNGNGIVTAEADIAIKYSKTASSSSAGTSNLYTYTASSEEDIYVALGIHSTGALTNGDYLSVLVNDTEEIRLSGSTTADVDTSSINKLSLNINDIVTVKLVQATNTRLAYYVTFLNLE